MKGIFNPSTSSHLPGLARGQLLSSAQAGTRRWAWALQSSPRFKQTTQHLCYLLGPPHKLQGAEEPGMGLAKPWALIWH